MVPRDPTYTLCHRVSNLLKKLEMKTTYCVASCRVHLSDYYVQLKFYSEYTSFESF